MVAGGMDMRMVQKFGGTSLAEPRLLRRAAAIAAQAAQNGQVAVVVSAQGDTTDRLIAQAAEVSPSPAARELDTLLSAGEQMSAALLAMTLAERGTAARSLVGWQAGIHTDGGFGGARITDIDPSRVLAAMEGGVIPVVAGFQGVSAGEITTLGRGGSDTTAVALGVAAIFQTSPLAFTGNKFEFRMPGSAENLSDANTILNTAVAKELKQFVADVEGAADFECAAAAWVKKTLNDHRRVIFNGNGYSEAWEAEAARRGLPNRKCTPDAMVALKEEKNISLMEEFGVLTKVEMESRYEVEMEHYSKIINIEALTMLEMARKQLLPAINAYMSEVANTAASKLAVSENLSVRSETKALTRLSADADAMSDAVDELQAAVDAAKALSDESAKAVAFHDDVLPKMDALRAAADDAETICGEDYWPLPSYSKMLYYV